MRTLGSVVLLALATGFAALPAGAQSGSANPHGDLPEGMDCTACHTTGGWTELRDPLGFTHGAGSDFVLEGAHQATPCRGCHLDLRFDAPRVRQLECGACHADVHDGRMVDACAACHDTRSFFEVDGELAHARTALPLTGAHAQVPCQGCHAQDRLFFTGLEPDCATCHLADFRVSTVVDHEAAGFSTDCTQCHSDLGWADSPAFDHLSASGGYGLEGAHAMVRCASCHQVPGMAPIYASQGPEDCVACHQDEYDREHGATTAFPPTCVQCHTQTRWGGAEFGHDEVTGFPLLGRHARLECRACHAVPGYGLLFPAPVAQDDCVACHQRDYDAEHAGDGYPTTCALCHTPENWDADLDHDARFFPVFSGAHDNRWDSCATCHTVPSDFGVFTCLACHEHNQADTDNDHSEVNDYIYESNGCFSCHPTGKS